jgi:hypothetical protein
MSREEFTEMKMVNYREDDERFIGCMSTPGERDSIILKHMRLMGLSPACEAGSFENVEHQARIWRLSGLVSQIRRELLAREHDIRLAKGEFCPMYDYLRLLSPLVTTSDEYYGIFD